MVSNFVDVTSTDVEVEPVGINKILGFRGKIVVPFSHITDVSEDYGILGDGGAWRTAGTSVFGKQVGHYRENGVKAYVNITHGEQPLLIQLEGEKFDQLVLGVDDPQLIMEKINRFTKKNFRKRAVKTEGKDVTGKLYRSVLYNAIIILGIVIVFLGIVIGVISGTSPKLSRMLLNIVPYVGGLMIIFAVIAIVMTFVTGQMKNRK